MLDSRSETVRESSVGGFCNYLNHQNYFNPGSFKKTAHTDKKNKKIVDSAVFLG